MTEAELLEMLEGLRDHIQVKGMDGKAWDMLVDTIETVRRSQPAEAEFMEMFAS